MVRILLHKDNPQCFMLVEDEMENDDEEEEEAAAAADQEDHKFVVRCFQNTAGTCSVNVALHCLLTMNSIRKRFNNPNLHKHESSSLALMKRHIEDLGGTTMTEAIRKALDERCCPHKNRPNRIHHYDILLLGDGSNAPNRIDRFLDESYKHPYWRNPYGAIKGILSVLSHEAACLSQNCWRDFSFENMKYHDFFVQEFTLLWQIEKTCFYCRERDDQPTLGWGLNLNVVIKNRPVDGRVYEKFARFMERISGFQRGKYITFDDVLIFPWGCCKKCSKPFVEYCKKYDIFSFRGRTNFVIGRAPPTLIVNTYINLEIHKLLYREELDLTKYMTESLREREGSLRYGLVAMGDYRSYSGHTVAYVKGSRYINERNSTVEEDHSSSELWYEVDNFPFSKEKQINLILEKHTPVILIYERVRETEEKSETRREFEREDTSERERDRSPNRQRNNSGPLSSSSFWGYLYRLTRRIDKYVPELAKSCFS